MAGRGRPLLAVATVLLALVAAVGLVPALRSSSSSDPGGSAAPSAPPVPTGTVVAQPPADDPPSPSLRGVSVAVLNGTTRTGVPRVVGDRLERHGATLDAVGTAPDQTRSRTVVSHAPAAARHARSVATILGLSEIRPRAAADVAFAPRADVLVLVGADHRGG